MIILCTRTVFATRLPNIVVLQTVCMGRPSWVKVRRNPFVRRCCIVSLTRLHDLFIFEYLDGNSVSASPSPTWHIHIQRMAGSMSLGRLEEEPHKERVCLSIRQIDKQVARQGEDNHDTGKSVIGVWVAHSCVADHRMGAC